MRGSSKHRDRRKRLQLGMPIGTASARLRKQILFLMVQETNRDSCFRCGTKIETADDLTFDHKVPWIDESVDLFWDLNNVAFSHSLCNSLSRRTTAGKKIGPSVLRKIGPPGTAWCTRCAGFLSASEFHRNKAKWSGLQSFCRKCMAGPSTDGISQPEAIVLAHLAEHRVAKVAELHKLLSFRRTTVTAAMKRLVQRGLVVRYLAVGGGRGLRLELTEYGSCKAHKLLEEFERASKLA